MHIIKINHFNNVDGFQHNAQNHEGRFPLAVSDPKSESLSVVYPHFSKSSSELEIQFGIG